MANVQRLLGAWLLAFATLVAQANGEEGFLEPTQRTDAPYRLFSTQNIYAFLKLDTRTGQVWQVQWGDEEKYRFEGPINLIWLSSRKEESQMSKTVEPAKKDEPFAARSEENT